MLSLFPELLFLAPLSAFVIRVVAGIAIGMIAYKHVSVPTTFMRVTGIVEGVVAILLIVGAYTQAAAVIGVLLAGFMFFTPAMRTLPRSTLFFLAVLCLSLIVTGAGPFAFDLPL